MSMHPSITIDDYDIIDRLGSGNFATVYLAAGKTDEQPERVAIKTLNPPIIEDSVSVDRFHREARILQRLSHPNVIKFYDFGTAQDTYYIVMEYIPDGSLRDSIALGALTRSEVYEIIKGVGLALTLSHEHRNKIIHRDIKPENILIDRQGDIVRSVLSDFGLVKQLSVEYVRSIYLSDSMAGTLNYMPPENIQGEVPRPETDIYALAITIFEMLCGKRPYSISMADLAQKNLDELIPPLPSISELVPDLGPYFDKLLIKAAAKNPNDRFSSIAELIEALEEANNLAENDEQQRTRNNALDKLKPAQNYLKTEDYKPEIALQLIEEAIHLAPTLPEALSMIGEVKFKQKLYVEGMEAHQQAYELSQDPNSSIGQNYLQALERMGQHFLKHNNYLKSLEYYQTMGEIIAAEPVETLQSKSPTQQSWLTALATLASFFKDQNASQIKSFLLGERVNDNIKALYSFLGLLEEELPDPTEAEPLRNLLNDLSIDQLEQKAGVLTQKIKNFPQQSQNDQLIFDYYDEIDQAYQALVQLDSENAVWQIKQKDATLKNALYRKACAEQAQKGLKPDFELALKHYYTIKDMELQGYVGLAQELDLDLDQIIENLEQETQLKSKYLYILRLMNDGVFDEALHRLHEDFIIKGFYDYEDTPQHLWELVYARQNCEQLPFGEAGLDTLNKFSQQIVKLEQTKISTMRQTLVSWSNFANYLDEIGQAFSTLQSEVEAFEHRLIETPENRQIYYHHLHEMQDFMQTWHDQQRNIEINLTPQLLADWLQLLADYETNLTNYDHIANSLHILIEGTEVFQKIETHMGFQDLKDIQHTKEVAGHKIAKAQAMLYEFLYTNRQSLQQKRIRQIKQVITSHVLFFPIILLITLLAGSFFNVPYLYDRETPLKIAALIAIGIYIIYLFWFQLFKLPIISQDIEE